MFNLKNAGRRNAAPPAPLETTEYGLLEGPIPAKLLLLTAGVAFGGLYALFQLHLLPKSWGRWVSKLVFWPTLPFTMLRRTLNYWTQMDETVFLGAAPVGFLGHVDTLYASGVRGVINLCGEYKGPLADYKHFGIEQLWVPTVDHFEPELADYVRGVDFIKRFHKRGEKILVHCKAGHGRSGAIVMGWLLATNPSATPLEVQRRMNSKRSVRKYLYKQSNLRLFYKSLQTASDGSGKDRESIKSK